ncbi:UNVERIFIED_CONTAM: hypothetical protein Slati_0989400 [Sesamum latifolium]|uniref:Uncharacterized protein n=1 Tax=Sesamum latifolium TaxID=2727402 RepID=A0AAW2XR94_9LAMI
MTLSPPLGIFEASAARVPTVLVQEPEGNMTYWWNCEDESIFWVFHLMAGKFIRK